MVWKASVIALLVSLSVARKEVPPVPWAIASRFESAAFVMAMVCMITFAESACVMNTWSLDKQDDQHMMDGIFHFIFLHEHCDILINFFSLSLRIQ